MPYCSNCGAEVGKKANFCPMCGFDLATNRFVDTVKNPPETIEQSTLGEEDIRTLMEALEKGTPCIPFIPMSVLRLSLSGFKSEALKGYFVASIPTLFGDGTVKYLYKEEFHLFMAANGLLGSAEECGRTHFFLGLYQYDEEDVSQDKPYLNPEIFECGLYTLFDVEFREEMRPTYMSGIYVPMERKPRARNIGVVNFLLLSHLYPIEMRDEPSQLIQSYEDWEKAGYSTSGDSLAKILDDGVQFFKNELPTKFKANSPIVSQIRTTPTTAKDHHRRALDHRLRGEYADALQEYTKAIELDNSWVLPYYERGEVNKRLDRKFEAIADFEKVISLSDKSETIEAAKRNIEELQK